MKKNLRGLMSLILLVSLLSSLTVFASATDVPGKADDKVAYDVTYTDAVATPELTPMQGVDKATATSCLEWAFPRTLQSPRRELKLNLQLLPDS